MNPIASDLLARGLTCCVPSSMSATPRDTSGKRELRWTFLGRVSYAPAFRLQERLRREILSADGGEHLLLLEHDPVFTIGRNASASDVLADSDWLRSHGVEVVRSNRGGQVTYHGPGQLVCYPVIDLDPDRRDVRRYVRDLQETVIRTLGDYGLTGRRRPGKDLIGVWVGEEKIASVGVHLSRWVPIHGFALNVTTDLSHFGGIVACGLPEVRMTSIERLTGTAPAVRDVAARVAGHLAAVFGREPVAISASPLLEVLGSYPAAALSRARES